VSTAWRRSAFSHTRLTAILREPLVFLGLVSVFVKLCSEAKITLTLQQEYN
jgi:hypothetical protein